MLCDCAQNTTLLQASYRVKKEKKKKGDEKEA